MGCHDDGVLSCWALMCQALEVLGYHSAEMTECWGVGFLECWGVRVLGYCRPVLEASPFQTIRDN